jgi:hypothetical protein
VRYTDAAGPGLAVPWKQGSAKTAWCEMPITTELAVTRPNVNDARSVALFASGLQPSDAPAPKR